MFKLVSRVAATVVLMSGVAFGQCRQETVQHTPPNGMTCEVTGCQGGSNSLIIYEPKIGGFSFGLSGVFIEPHLSSATLTYKSYGLKHKVTPQFVWGAWVVGLGTVTYTVL